MADIFRIQDRDGRGPFRPGFSASWAEANKPPFPPSVYEELPDLQGVFYRLSKRTRLHFGCAVRGANAFRLWFSPVEIKRLRDFGFSLVACDGLRIVAETPNQVVIASRIPLKFLPTIEFDEALT